ncbi:HNH endonuclease [Roseobacter phage CRP-403]|uniref:HNH endonuclease n=1 Tax=Roseobacter phage CRP-403 TaxID=3072849 RepID=A0AAX3ZXA0_9CAUD|nr:HNH endonuclease [Roseobacter phage CRP-403]
MSKSGRVYSEYDKKYQARPEQVKKRVSRNAARRMMIAKHGKSKLAGKDIDHSDGNATNNSKNNLKIMGRSENRAKK